MKKLLRIFSVLLILSLAILMCACNIQLPEDNYSGNTDSGVKDDASIEENELDYIKIANKVTSDAVKFNVKIDAYFYKSGYFGFSQAVSGSQGSGVIYKSDEKYYYVLTNAHVVEYNGDYNVAEYTVYDMYGNEYKSELLASAAEYDLAALRFTKDSKIALGTVEFAEELPVSRDVVITLGTPKGQINAVTWGRVATFRKIQPSPDSENPVAIEFDVIVHTCLVEHGASGGALINTDMKLVGVNYALAGDENKDVSYGLAIPIDKVIEFLENNALL